MIDVARRVARDAGVANVEFVQADAQVYPFEAASYDAVVGRTAVMFFGDPAAGFANLHRALRAGGRLSAFVWQEPANNEWAVEIMSILAAGRDLPGPPPDAPHPFALADPKRAAQLLSGAGFSSVGVDAIAEKMRFGSNADEAIEVIRGPMGWLLDTLDEAPRQEVLRRLRAALEARTGPDGVLYGSAGWLLTATA
jgi:SAM-dependent methyltransferase